MNLVIDTSSAKLQVSLFKNKIIAENIDLKIKTLPNLLPQIDKVLSDAKVGLEDIKTFCVVVGPGSFTGIRIGIATIKAFLNVFKTAKCVGINMLDFLAWKVFKSFKIVSDIAILIKSTSSKFYVGTYNKNCKLISYKHLSSDVLKNQLKAKDYRIFCFDCQIDLDAEALNFSKNDLVLYCEKEIKNKKFLTEKELKPFYLALSQAEEEFLKKRRV